MDKIFKHYFVNRPITEVVTDVKVIPGVDVDDQTLGKYVDPITGEVKYTTGDYKTVDEKIVPVLDDILRKHQPFVRPTIEDLDVVLGGDKYNKFYNVKDALLKRMYLNKIKYGDDYRKIDEVFPEYQTITETETKYPTTLFEKFDRMNKMNRFENIVDKINHVDYTTRPVVDTVIDDLLAARKYNTKDLLTRVPLTKEMKDFDLELPTTKTL